MTPVNIVTDKILPGYSNGRLTVICEVEHIARITNGRKDGYRRRYECICSCGKTVTVERSVLTRKTPPSCGCARSESLRRRNFRHGLTDTPEYVIWVGMLGRCSTSTGKNRCYQGISVCEKWRTSFTEFLDHIGPRPTPLHSVDRWPDPSGNYEPGNVRWATTEQQNRNQRRNIYVEYRGERRLVVEWVKEFGLNYDTVRERREKGWTGDRLFSVPRTNKTGPKP